MNMETSEFIRPSQSLEKLELEPVSCGATCITFKFQCWGKWFLLKRLKPELRNDPAATAAFEKEFDLGIRLDHSGIVRYFEKGIDAEGIYIVEEFIDGETLDTYFQREGPLSDDEVRRIFGEIAEAVAYLHESGIVHADLKSDNVLITRQGHHAKLIDLGFSSHYSYDPVKDGDVRADIPSLGKILNVLSSGKHRFGKIARKAMDGDISKRYQSAATMAAAVRNKPWHNVLASAVALSIMAAFCYPLWKPAISPNQTPDIIRDTVYITQISLEDSVIAALRGEFRQRYETIFGPFDSSYEKVDGSNYDRLVREYQNVFYKLVEARDSLSSAFSASYPEQAEKIERAANEEFGNVTETTRFQKELLKWQQKVLSAQ